jgi:isoleucyl-tRNA synthetase
MCRRRREKTAETLRERALPRSRPPVLSRWGKARLHAMIANRPDWTLSRQRQWGVPMPFFSHKETGELHPRTPELLEPWRSASRAEGIEAWQALDAAELLGDDAAQYEKIRDTLDVWFDSGTTHQHGAARLACRPKAPSRPTCTSKARTSIAAGSIPRCSPAA